jgi:hypothetical protein
MTQESNKPVEMLACPCCEMGSNYCRISTRGNCGGVGMIPAGARAIYDCEEFARELSNPATRLSLALAAWNTRHRLSSQQDREAVLEEAPSFQGRVGKWAETCFPPRVVYDRLERRDRFVEEALELAQTLPDFTADRAHALVDYVFSRPVGLTKQEVGGARVTLAALCHAEGIDEQHWAEVELARISEPEVIEKIRAKQAAKPTGSALPIALTTPPSTVEGSGPASPTMDEIVEVPTGDLREYARFVADLPCETKGAEDLEPGCCLPCRARSLLSRFKEQG